MTRSASTAITRFTTSLRRFHGIRCRTILANLLRSPGCTVSRRRFHCVRRDSDAWAHLLQSIGCVNATQAGISMSDYNVTTTNHRHRSVAGECIVLLLGAMLVSCGGGGGGSSPPPVSPGPPPAPVPPPPPPPGTTVPPLASPAIALETVTRVGVDRWPAKSTANGGQGQTVGGLDCLPNMLEDSTAGRLFLIHRQER